MSRTNADSFLEEFSPLSEALLPNINAQNANNSTTSFYVTIGTEKCFKPFVSKFFDGIGNIGLSGALDGIRGMETFHNLHSIAFVNSDKMSATEKRDRIFFGSSDNIQVLWDYCILSK